MTKRLLYLHQHFRSPKDWGGTRSFSLGSGLAKNGWEVDLITAHNGVKYKIEEFSPGFKVHFLPVPYSQNMPRWKRLLAFRGFNRLALAYIKTLPKPSVVFATSTPLSIGTLASMLKERYGWPYIFEVRDLWPEVPDALGLIPFWARRIAYNSAKEVYKGADSIVSLSEGTLPLLKEYVPRKVVHLIPNFSEVSKFNLDIERDWSKPWKVLYAGHLGYANQVEILLKAASYCQSQKLQVEFTIAGEGSKREKLQNLAKKLNLSNTKFLPPQDKDSMPAVMQAHHFGYVSFRNNVMLHTASPNKLFDYMASGLVTINNTGGWIKDMLSRNTAGLYHDPNLPEQLCSLLKDLTPKMAQVMSINAKSIAGIDYSDKVALEKMLQILAPYS